MPVAKFYGCLTFIPFSVKASITSARFSADQPLYWFKHGPTGAKAPLRANVRRSLLANPAHEISQAHAEREHPTYFFELQNRQIPNRRISPMRIFLSTYKGRNLS